MASSWSPDRSGLPNLFLVGAMKAGTTTLADILAAHPQVMVPAIKEPNFFCHDLNARLAPGDPCRLGRHELERLRQSRHYAVIDEPCAYLSLFAGGEGRPVRADCSTTYLYSDVAAEAIAATVPEARILVTLRDPVDRAFSDYLMGVRTGRERLSFAEAVEEELARSGPLTHGGRAYVRAGLYAAQLERYLGAFPEGQVKVMVFEEWIRDPARAAAEVFAFLGLEGEVDLAGVGRRNEGRVARYPRLNRHLYETGLKRLVSRFAPPALKERGKALFYSRSRLPRPDAAVRARLADIFAPDIRRLEARLGRDLPDWSP